MSLSQASIKECGLLERDMEKENCCGMMEVILKVSGMQTRESLA